MSTLSAKCPFCLTEKVGFTSIGEYQHPSNPGTVPTYTVFFVCGMCYKGVSVIANVAPNQMVQGQSPYAFLGNLRTFSRFNVSELLPPVPQPKVPDHLLPPIATFYLQAVDNEDRKNWDGCGAMCRKVLDVATKDLGCDKSEGIKTRLKNLHSKGILTQALVDWADAIWVDGCDASHDSDPFKEEEARRLRSFTELFLMYVYSLPGMLKERQSKPSPTTP